MTETAFAREDVRRLDWVRGPSAYRFKVNLTMQATRSFQIGGTALYTLSIGRNKVEARREQRRWPYVAQCIPSYMQSVLDGLRASSMYIYILIAHDSRGEMPTYSQRTVFDESVALIFISATPRSSSMQPASDFKVRSAVAVNCRFFGDEQCLAAHVFLRKTGKVCEI